MNNAQRLQDLIDQYRRKETGHDAGETVQYLADLVVVLAEIEIARHVPPVPTGAMATPKSLRRYDADGLGGMDEDAAGGWVMYDDVLPILAALRNLYRVHADWNNVSKRAEALIEAKRVLGL